MAEPLSARSGRDRRRRDRRDDPQRALHFQRRTFNSPGGAHASIPVMRAIILFALFAVLTASAVTAFAHHAGGTFARTKSVRYNSTLRKVELVNPHSWLYFDVKDADGKVSHHRCEMRSVHVLRRSGWNKEQFPIGVPVTVEAAPDRVDPNSCY